MDNQSESHTPVVGRPDNYDSDYSVFVKAKDRGEITFTLRSQDQSAAECVEFWAYINEPALGKEHPKIVQAREIAAKMRNWPGRRQAD
jgi:hypothetical protein